MSAGKPHTQGLRRAVRAFFAFTVREKRAILYLLPLLIVGSVLLAALDRPRFEKSFAQVADHACDSMRAARRTVPETASGTEWRGRDVRHSENPPGNRTTGEPFPFDPNTVDLAGLERLGFSRRQAQGILNYRAAGKVFRRAADFADCYTVSEAMYARLAPYIVIAPRADPAADRAADRAADPAAPAVPPAEPSSLPPEPPAPRQTAPAKIDLNTADSAALVAVSGIGPLTAGRIVAYRARLGGFARPEQLAEVQGMTEQNYERIVQQIFADGVEIQKIDINFADPKRLEAHPYLTATVRRKILKQRQLKGGWRTIGEMIEDKTLSPAEAEKLTPYLRFTPVE